jgi:hypothetical protein
MILQYEWNGLKKIISGGQHGTDLGALKAAKDRGFPTGGTAPKGWRTTTGSNPALADYGLVECYSTAYPIRTEMNVMDSDGTLIISSDLASSGTVLTINCCKRHHRPFYIAQFNEGEASNIVSFIEREGISVLNVAGNHLPSKVMEALAFKIVSEVLTLTIRKSE